MAVLVSTIIPCCTTCMLSISHSATGAFLATALPNPIIYIPLIIASHYLEDWIPHWDVGTGLSTGKRKRSHAIILELGELLISGVIIYIWWQAGHATLNVHAWAGAFFGLLPDFVEAPRNFLHFEPWFIKPFNRLHGMFHHSTPNMVLGLAPQVLVLIAVGLMR